MLFRSPGAATVALVTGHGRQGCNGQDRQDRPDNTTDLLTGSLSCWVSCRCPVAETGQTTGPPRGPFTEQIGGSVLTVLCVLSDAALSDRDDPLSGGATADVKKPLLIGIVALRRD